MAQRSIKAGSTGVILAAFLQDSSVTTGAGLAGLLFNTANLTCYYKRNKGNASVAVTLATMTLGTWAAGGFAEADATHMKGVYDFCPPDAALAAGAESVTFYFQGATNLAPTPILVELTATDNQTAGVPLTAAGLDAVTVEAGLNARQALSIIAAAVGGVLSGATGANVLISAAGVPATNRLNATVDANGNRTAVALSPPA